jgi:hypothetical protein
MLCSCREGVAIGEIELFLPDHFLLCIMLYLTSALAIGSAVWDSKFPATVKICCEVLNIAQ